MSIMSGYLSLYVVMAYRPTIKFWTVREDQVRSISSSKQITIVNEAQPTICDVAVETVWSSALVAKSAHVFLIWLSR